MVFVEVGGWVGGGSMYHCGWCTGGWYHNSGVRVLTSRSIQEYSITHVRNITVPHMTDLP